VKLLILVVDDEPDVEELFRQQFRRDLRAGRFNMEFTESAPAALQAMITAYGDAETKRQALENGAEALLTKPIDFTVLRSEIDTRIERAA
jgi:CheY-like chemotaxis protein